MVKAFLKSLTTPGVWEAIRLVRAEFSIQRRHRASVRLASSYQGRDDLRLNFGCGPNKKSGWVNIDLFNEDADLHLDVRQPVPLVGDSASFIYSEHFFEHLSYPGDAQKFLAESMRILRPGGTFSLGVPDTEWAVKGYLGGGGEWFRTAQELGWHPDWCDTPLHSLNYHFRQDGEHKYAYDFETLERVLSDAGFTAIRNRSFDPDLDHESRRAGTLYVDARKPG